MTQALMELGATVCVPNGAPLCEACPLSDICLAARDSCQTDYPVRAEKKQRRMERITVFVLNCAGFLALRKRPATGLLAGLWEFPNVPGYLEAQEDLMSKRLSGFVRDTSMGDDDRWFYEQFARCPEILLDPVTEEERSAFSEATAQEGARPWEPDWIAAQSDEVYRYSVKIRYQSTDQFIQATVEDEQIDCLFFFTLTENNQALILSENRKDGERNKPGTVLDVPLSEHPAIKKIVCYPSCWDVQICSMFYKHVILNSRSPPKALNKEIDIFLTVDRYTVF
jgi:hypothetical protein